MSFLNSGFPGSLLFKKVLGAGWAFRKSVATVIVTSDEIRSSATSPTVQGVICGTSGDGHLAHKSRPWERLISDEKAIR